MKKTSEIFLIKDSITVKVDCYSFHDKNTSKYIAFCPALNISDYAAKEDDAKEGLDTLINDAVEFSLTKGQLTNWLLSLGWKVQAKPVMVLEPPNESFLKSISSEFNRMIGAPHVKQTSKEIQFA